MLDEEATVMHWSVKGRGSGSRLQGRGCRAELGGGRTMGFKGRRRRGV